MTSNHKSVEPIRAKGLPPLPKVKQIAMLVDDKNYSQVDLYSQHILRVLPNDPHANLACAWVANHFKLVDHRDAFFRIAEKNSSTVTRSLTLVANDLHIKLEDLKGNYDDKQIQNKQGEKYHLSKAWGFGFGSEMSALMGQAYLAEATGRQLVVHWGSNFLYRPSEGETCVFDCYFKPFNTLDIDTIKSIKSDIYPPKWKHANLEQENIGKRKGQFSKLSALYFFDRPETITVSDYYAGVVNIKPWVSEQFPLKQLSVDDTYRYLAKKYLQPQPSIIAEVDRFVSENLSEDFVAVHARGSDKDEGYRALTSIPGQILQSAKKRLEEMPSDTRLFLMTDDTALLEVYKSEFGERLVQTDCQRCDTQVGVHYDEGTNKLQAGKEMLIDMLIAARANTFVGLGLSNPSQLIMYLGDFDEDKYILFGENRLKQFNTHLYKTIAVR